MKCPHDGIEMDRVSRHGVEIDHCPVCGGIWLDRGELDHLMEAVRPAVELANPDPAPPPEPPRPVVREASSRGAEYKPKKKKKAKRFEDRGKQSRPGEGKRYRGRYSKKSRLADILEEIFDFD